MTDDSLDKKLGDQSAMAGSMDDTTAYTPPESAPVQDVGFANLVDDELARSRMLHTSIASPHEGLAVILEQFEHLSTAIFRKDIDPNSVLHELVQLAAMCRRTAEDCSLL
jgi:hypothetical protein